MMLNKESKKVADKQKDKMIYEMRDEGVDGKGKMCGRGAKKVEEEGGKGGWECDIKSLREKKQRPKKKN